MTITDMSDVQKLQVQAYFSEYQAMMARVNWFMSLQFIPLTPLVAFLAIVGAVYRFLEPHLIAWTTAAVVEVAVLVYYFSLHEVYNHIRYIEVTLKPRVAALLNGTRLCSGDGRATSKQLAKPTTRA